MTRHAHELVIIGGGPAGLAAGLYAARDGLDCILLEKNDPGGQLLLSTTIANCPGFPGAPAGREIAERLTKHAESFGLRIRKERATSLSVEGSALAVATDRGEYATRAVIIASGSSSRALGVPGEANLRGRGVSYCGSCDGPLFRDKSIIVVGGGDTALEEAIFLTRFARELKVVHRRRRLRAGPYLQRQAFANEKIEFIWDSVVREIDGEDKVEGVVVEDVRDGKRREVPCDGVFIFIGSTPNTGFLRGTVELDKDGYVVTDVNMRSSHPGVFAAGEVRRDSVKQVAACVGDGVTALIHAERYIEGQD